MRRRTSSNAAGFTLLEAMIGIVILTLILANVHLVSKSGATVARSGALRSSLENELELTLDRITFALMAADEAEIEGPAPAPMPSSFVRFASVIGRDAGGNVLMSPTEQIAWAAHIDEPGGAGGKGVPGEGSGAFMEGGRVTWTENADLAETRNITWSNSVPLAYLGEVGGNAEDDNGNDLLDENGLAFARDGSQVQVFLTVERIDDRGKRQPVQRSLRIAPRN